MSLLLFCYVCGGVVQLVRTSACHAEGREFEPRLSRHFSREVDGSSSLFFMGYT